MTEYTAKRARTRGQLLAAGQELLPGAVRRGLEHALGPGPVTQRAEVSRQTWYRYWRADDSAYLDELLRVALDTVTFLLGPRLAALASGLEPGATANRIGIVRVTHESGLYRLRNIIRRARLPGPDRVQPRRGLAGVRPAGTPGPGGSVARPLRRHAVGHPGSPLA